MGYDGSEVSARYSFFYVYSPSDGKFKIQSHHSSQFPEGLMPKGEELSDAGVRALFQLWNNALLSGDPDEVAKRYSKDPVLLPTVSDM